MDKRIILSVAGSGKTTYIINHLNEEKNFLIVTYTNNNIKNIREKIVTKFGYFPKNINLQTYHKFIYSFCIIPFLGYSRKINGIYLENPPEYTRNLNSNDKKRYMSSNRKLYKSRMAKFIEIEGIMPEIFQRLEKYYDFFCIDEIQDLSGYDFDFILNLSESNINMMMVGDFYQHTFKTSADGNKNSSLYKDYEKYKKRYKEKGIKVDETILNKSYRVSEEICNFIENEMGIFIQSHRMNNSKINFVENKENIQEIMQNNKIIKLFYQNSSKYKCFSQNWGDSKGIDKYEDVCVILNKTTMDCYKKRKLKDLAALTKNKLYVACTRARGKLYFIEEAKVKEYKKE